MEVKDDGVFYMPFKKFKRFFNEFQVCMIEDDFKYTCVRSSVSYNEP